MKNLAKLSCAVALACAASTGQAASMLGNPAQADDIVVAGGLEWIWAGPCAPNAPSCGVVNYHDNFRLPTASEWLASFVDTADLVSKFIGPANLNGFDANGQKCASPEFNTNYDHCDSGDLGIGAAWGAPAPVGGQYTDNPNAEAFLVRGDRQEVPVPGTLGLFGLGLAGLGLVRRRK